MGEEGKRQMFISPSTQFQLYEKDDGHNDNTISSTSSSSIESSSSLDTTTEDDASSSNSNESLYNLSDLMTQLPIKRRGLSKYYQGRSQSFTCISRAKSIEDLGKKESGYIINTRIKAHSKSLSIHGGLNNYKSYTHHHHHHPKPIISKKTTRQNILLPVQENVMQVAIIDQLSPL